MVKDTISLERVLSLELICLDAGHSSANDWSVTLDQFSNFFAPQFTYIQDGNSSSS